MNKRILLIIPALLLAMIISGCAGGIGVKAASRSNYSLLNRPDDLMPQTANVLANFSLNKEYNRNPQGVLTKLEKIFFAEPRSEYLIALADVSSKLGKRFAGDQDLAIRYYLSSVLYCYCYVALENPADQAYDPSAVLMLRTYNSSLAEVIHYLCDRNLLTKNGYELTTAAGQTITFRNPQIISSITPDRIEKVLLCADYEPEHLINNSRKFGIGTPLITVLKPSKEYPRYSENQALPLTAVLAIDNAKDSTFARCDAQLILIDPRSRDKITLSKRSIPLEYDLSTPLAYMAGKPQKHNHLVRTFMPEKIQSQEGLYHFEPINPDRIPVVMVHGLMSDTKTWLQMLNTLQSDPDIRNNYQFWGVSYSSGNPIFHSAKLMRDTLVKEREKLAKQGLSTRKFDRMVLIGHSMGGLISRLATSTCTIQDLYAVVPDEHRKLKLEDKIDKEDKELILSMLNFSPLPFVKRVIFISVPHRGSSWATNPIGRMGAGFIHLPVNILRRQQRIIKTLIATGKLKDVPVLLTGIDNLAPDDISLRLLNRLPMNKDIPYHSIIGNREGNGIPGGSDGIVTYASSHIDNVESELVVKSGHSAQRNPLAIQELRRILLAHLKNYNDVKVSKPLELKVSRISGLENETDKDLIILKNYNNKKEKY